DVIVGGALWTLVMYPAGLLGAYYRILAVFATLGPFLIGIRVAATRLASGRRAGSRGRGGDDLVWSGLVAGLVLMGMLCIVYFGVGLSKLHPDSSHYLPYYAEVVRSHGTAPNDYWYHFWSTKGAGLHFLAVMLGDIFAPPLMSCVLLLATAGVVLSFV